MHVIINSTKSPLLPHYRCCNIDNKFEITFHIKGKTFINTIKLKKNEKKHQWQSGKS